MSEITIFAEKSIISLKFQENHNFLYFSKLPTFNKSSKLPSFQIFQKSVILGTDAVAVHGFRPTFSHNRDYQSKETGKRLKKYEIYVDPNRIFKKAPNSTRSPIQYRVGSIY